MKDQKRKVVTSKTGVKNIYIRMDADTQSCSIGIDIKHPEVLQRKAFFVKFISFKSHFKATVDGGWSWLEEIQDDDGSTVSKIVAEKKGVNVLNKESWPEMISFFKERLVALDDFWLTVKPLFE